MLVNVATLVQEHVGSDREIDIVDETIELPEFAYERVLNGTARLICTARGVLARDVAQASVTLTSSAQVDSIAVPYERCSSGLSISAPFELECGHGLQGYDTP